MKEAESHCIAACSCFRGRPRRFFGSYIFDQAALYLAYIVSKDAPHSLTAIVIRNAFSDFLILVSSDSGIHVSFHITKNVSYVQLFTCPFCGFRIGHEEL